MVGLFDSDPTLGRTHSNKGSMKRVKSESELRPGEFDLERMKATLAGPTFELPSGLTFEEFQAVMAAVAKEHYPLK